jgi:hypothetical protein
MTKLALTITLFFFGQVSQLWAQEELSEIKVSGSFQHAPLAQFIQNLEKQQAIHFYYQDEWIDTMEVNLVFDEMPLVQVLNRLFGQSRLGYRFFQNSIVLFPRASVAGKGQSLDESSVLYIGDPINIGRYKKATIRGTIMDGKLGDRLPGAIIYVRDLDKGASTNGQGEFEIELPTGKHHLQISFVGFEPMQQEIELIESGDAIFDLFEESHNLQEIKVSANNTNASRTQMSMMRVDAKQIKELPVLMGEADVIKSVVMMPGVQSVGELSSGFNVRGGNVDQNLVLIDGAPVYNTSHLFGFFSMINPDAVSDVTFYKGGLPARYGDRVASVMDVRLKEGSTDHLQLYGGIGVINSRFTLEGPFVKGTKSSFLLGGRSTYSDWILRQMRNIQFRNSVARFYDLNGNINLHLGDRNNLKIMGYSSADEFNLNSGSLYEYTNLIGALNWKVSSGGKWVSEFNATYSQYNFSLNEKDEYLSELDYELRTGIEHATSKYILSFLPNEKLKLNGGFQLSAMRVNPGEILPAQDTSSIVQKKVPDEQAFEVAGFAEGEFDISDNFSVTLGLRYSRFTTVGPETVYRYGPNYSRSLDRVLDSLVFGENKPVKTYQGLEPRVSFRYKLNSGGSLRWAYQRVYQYLNQISNTSVVSPADFWKMSDYHLQPLISDQFALGYFKDVPQKGVEASAEMYYKKLQNLIEYKNGAHLLMNQNLETDLFQADGYAYGLELYLKKARGRLNGYMSYTYSRTMRKTNTVFDAETINDGKYYPSVYDKPHDVSITGNYQLSRRWRLSGNFVFSSGRPTTLPELRYTYGGQDIVYFSDRNKYRMPSYHRFDISITVDENLRRKRMWKGSWTFSIYNLYGRKNPYSVYYQREPENAAKNGLFGLYKFSVIGIPVPSLTYNFRF